MNPKIETLQRLVRFEVSQLEDDERNVEYSFECRVNVAGTRLAFSLSSFKCEGRPPTMGELALFAAEHAELRLRALHRVLGEVVEELDELTPKRPLEIVSSEPVEETPVEVQFRPVVVTIELRPMEFAIEAPEDLREDELERLFLALLHHSAIVADVDPRPILRRLGASR